MQSATATNDVPTPLWIALMFLGFVLCWPLGLAILVYLIWSGKMMCCIGRFAPSESDGRKRWNIPHGNARSTGNMAFDEYREAFAPVVLPFKRHRTTRYRDAHGVVAAVAPWNFPMRMPIGIVMPSLAGGNALILKPTEHAPLVGAMIHEAFAPHLPKDVIHYIAN